MNISFRHRDYYVNPVKTLIKMKGLRRDLESFVNLSGSEKCAVSNRWSNFSESYIGNGDFDDSKSPIYIGYRNGYYQIEGGANYTEDGANYEE